MKNKIELSATVLLIILLSTALHAQPGGGGGFPGGGAPGTGAVPIDGGAILLAIGAAVYGRMAIRSKPDKDTL